MHVTRHPSKHYRYSIIIDYRATYVYVVSINLWYNTVLILIMQLLNIVCGHDSMADLKFHLYNFSNHK